MTCAVGFGVDFEIEIYRVGSTRNHSLLPTQPQDEHIVGIEINLFLCGYRYGEVIILSLVKVYLLPLDTEIPLCRKLDIGERIVGVLNRQAVFLGIGISQRIGVCLVSIFAAKLGMV